MTLEQIEQAFTEAGCRLDGGFSEYLIVGCTEHTSILAHSWVWEMGKQVFELIDERTGRAYWVHAITTPWQAELLLAEYGAPAEEEALADVR